MIPPVLALIAWTFVMWVWLYATRLPEIRRAKIDLAELVLLVRTVIVL